MQPRPWQAAELAVNRFQNKRAIFAAPRLGKTFVALECLASWNVSRALILTPLVVANYWERCLREHPAFQGKTITNLSVGTLKSRLRVLTDLKDSVIILNYDALKALEAELYLWHPEALIADESHYIKGISTARAKITRQLAWQARYVRLLTGTPIPNHYGDLWGQMVALDKQGWQSFTKFAARYLIRDNYFPTKIIGTRNVDELRARMLDYSSIVKRDDVFGPDTYQEVVRTVQLPPHIAKVYRKLLREWRIEAEDFTVSAEHILKRYIRLQQLAAGFLPDDTGTLGHLHTTKLDAVRADLEEIIESGERAIIFHRFSWESKAYAKMLEGMGLPPLVINGSTTPKERARVVDMINSTPSTVAVVQIQAGGVGISFAEAEHAMFTTRVYSYAEETQARDRIYKPGAVRCVTYYEAENTVDQHISKTIANKQRLDIELLRKYAAEAEEPQNA